MLSLQNKKIFAKILIAVAVLIFGLILFRAFYYAPSDEVPVNPETMQANPISGQEPTVTSPPARLVIPKINVDAPVQAVGITKKGNMATPNNFMDVGWYKYGPLPGNMGSAVIAGHVDNGVALPAVFYNLKKLESGDEIFITTESNELLRFTVVGSKVYDFNAKADEVFLENDRKLLKLITCTGVWLKDYRTRNQRLVVSAVLSE